MPLAAQETYENAKLMKGDLNGTARYVGMGGAMEALGADISTISTNRCRHRTVSSQHGYYIGRICLAERSELRSRGRQDQNEL